MSMPQLSGYLSLVIAQVTIGVNVVIGKYMLEFMPIYIFLGLRFLVSALGITFFFAVSRGRWLSPYHPTQKIGTYDCFLMMLQGLFGGFLFNYFFLWGLEYTTATSAGIISASLPVIIALSAIIFLKEKLIPSLCGAIVFAVMGILVIGLNNPEHGGVGHHGSYLGDMLILIAMLPEAWFSIVGKLLANRIRPFASALVANWVTFLCFLPFLITQGLDYDWSQVKTFHWLLISIGASGSILFFWLWPWGLKYVSATKASLFGGLMPVSTCLLAIIFLKEHFHLLEALGMFFVFVSLWMGSTHGHLVFTKVMKKVSRKGKQDKE